MWAVALHELKNSLKNRLFPFFTALCVVLFAANGFVYTKKYNSLNAVHRSRVLTALHKKSLPAGVVQEYSFHITTDSFPRNGGPAYPRPSTISTDLFMEPSPLMFLADGNVSRAVSGVVVRPGGIREQLHAGAINDYSSDGMNTDWMMIVTVVLTLFAILTGYRAVSGERESGTLTLVLSNGFSRAGYIAAKYCAYLFTVMIPFLLGAAVSLTMMAIGLDHPFTPRDTVCIALFAGSAMLFLSFFILLSLAISSMIRRSSLVLLILLIVWMVSIVQPHAISAILLRYSGPTTETVLKNRIDSVVNGFIEESKARFYNSSSPVFAGFMGSNEQAEKVIAPLIIENQKKIARIYADYENETLAFLRRTRNLNRLSPNGMLLDTAERSASSGLLSLIRFYGDAREFSSRYDGFIRDKQGTIVVATRHMMAVQYRKSPEISSVVQNPWPVEYNGDKSDFPRFEPRMPSIASVLHDSLLDIAGLLLWNLVLAMGAFLAFNRADVR